MTHDEIHSSLTEIFREAFSDDTLELKPETTAKDVPGWDSVRMVTLILAVEQTFGIRLRSREIDQLKCVGDFVSLIGSKV